MDLDKALSELSPDEQVSLLRRRLVRAEKARFDAEAVLERRARELDRSNRELRAREERLLENLDRGTRQLLAAQRAGGTATVFRARGEKFNFSPEFGKLLGFPEGVDVSPAKFLVSIHPLDRERMNRHEFAFYTELPVNQDHMYEHRIIRQSDREIRWIKWTLRRETNERGRFRAVFGTVQDITEQRKTERRARVLGLLAERRVKVLSRLSSELEHSNAEAEQANRSKSRFLAMMSHDIRTPMNGVLGMLETLSRSELDNDQRHQLDLARSSGQQLNILLNDIIEFVRAETGKIELQPEPLELRLALEGIVEFWSVANPNPQIEINCQIETSLPDYILVDPTRFRQLIDNLVSNAVKYTPNGEVHVIARSKGDVLRIEVQDTGPGISEEQQETLFKDFSRLQTMTAGSGQSAGLGLAICRRLLTEMGGAIGVDSEVGTGSCFWFEIPQTILTEEDLRAPSFAMTGETEPQMLEAHVLVVEDIETNREVLAAMLELIGCTYALVENGQEAIEAVRKFDFDIVLMDVNMPVLDGRGATRGIRKMPGKKGNTPIIGVTAHTMHSEHAELTKLGMNAFVLKPVMLDELRLKMSELLQQGDENADKEETATVLIDEEVGRQLFDVLTPEQRSKVLELTLHDMTNLSADLCSAIRAGEEEQVKRAAHSLKGVAGNIGATELTRVLAEGETKDAAEVERLVAETIADIRHRFVVD